MAAARFGWQQKRLNIAAGMFGVLWPDGLPFRNRPSQSGAPRSMKMGTIGSRWRGAGECEAVQERRFPDFKDIPMFRSLKKRRAFFAYWRRTATHWRLGLGFPLAISLAAVALVVAAHAQSAARAQEIWFHIGGMKMAHGHGGANVEGYDSPEETARIAAKLKRAGRSNRACVSCRTWRCSRRGCASRVMPSRTPRGEGKTTWSSNMCAQGTPDEFWRDASH
jgi:hypothetical protein